MMTNYENKGDIKFQVDVAAKNWKMNKVRMRGTPSISGSSCRSAKSSIRENRRLVEEAKFKVLALKEKHRLKHPKADIRRKVEMLWVSTEMKQTAVSLKIGEDVRE